MRQPKLIPLTMWAERRYAERVPSTRTLRRWVANANIFPTPQKEGRSWWVLETAYYVDPADPATYVREQAS